MLVLQVVGQAGAAPWYALGACSSLPDLPAASELQHGTTQQLNASTLTMVEPTHSVPGLVHATKLRWCADTGRLLPHGQNTRLLQNSLASLLMKYAKLPAVQGHHRCTERLHRSDVKQPDTKPWAATERLKRTTGISTAPRQAYDANASITRPPVLRCER